MAKGDFPLKYRSIAPCLGSSVKHETKHIVNINVTKSSIQSVYCIPIGYPFSSVRDDVLYRNTNIEKTT